MSLRQIKYGNCPCSHITNLRKQYMEERIDFHMWTQPSQTISTILNHFSDEYI